MQACSLKPTVQLFSSKASSLQRGTAVAAVQRLAAPAARSAQLVVEGKLGDAARRKCHGLRAAVRGDGRWLAHCANLACWTGGRAAGAAGAGGGGRCRPAARSRPPRLRSLLPLAVAS